MKKVQTNLLSEIWNLSFKLCVSHCILRLMTVSIFLGAFSRCPSGDNLILQFAEAEDVKLKCSHPAGCHHALIPTGASQSNGTHILLE